MIKIAFPWIEIDREIRTPARVAWELLTDTHQWPRWGPSVRAVECLERHIHLGAQGRVQTAVGLWLPFVITEFEAGHRWAWQVKGVPATGHRVEPLEAGRCRVVFEIPLLAAPYTAVCKVALNRIARILKAAGQHPAG